MQPGVVGQSEPVPPPPSMVTPVKKFNGKIIGGLVLVVLALIFAGIALTGAWWSWNMKASAMGITMEQKLEFGLGQACMSGIASQCFAYTSAENSKMMGVFSLIQILTILGLVMAILTLVLIIVGAGKPKMKIAVLLFGIIGAIMLLLAVVFAFSSLPTAFNDDVAAGGGISGFSAVSGFFGSASINLMGTSMELTYGGGLGWMMALIGFIMLLLGALVAMAGMKAAPVPPPMPAPPM